MTSGADTGHRGSPDRFGYEWAECSELRPAYEEQFRRWTVLSPPESWRDRRFPDVGCGMGRNSHWPMTYGAAGSASIDVDDRSLDRASMMNGLETRAPFLDNDLVEFCRRLPTAFKFAQGRGKRLLRRAMRGMVPDRILERPKKGFGVPVSKWLLEWPTPKSAHRPGVRDGAFARLWREHAMGRRDNRLPIWCCLGLQQLPDLIRAGA